MEKEELTDWVKSNLNQCYTTLRENKSAYVRLEVLIQIELLYQLIRTFRLELIPTNRKFDARVLNLIRTKRHFFHVILQKDYLRKEFDFSEP